jgi:hypothetical protein
MLCVCAACGAAQALQDKPSKCCQAQCGTLQHSSAAAQLYGSIFHAAQQQAAAVQTSRTQPVASQMQPRASVDCQKAKHTHFHAYVCHGASHSTAAAKCGARQHQQHVRTHDPHHHTLQQLQRLMRGGCHSSRMASVYSPSPPPILTQVTRLVAGCAPTHTAVPRGPGGAVGAVRVLVPPAKPANSRQACRVGE